MAPSWCPPSIDGANQRLDLTKKQAECLRFPQNTATPGGLRITLRQKTTPTDWRPQPARCRSSRKTPISSVGPNRFSSELETTRNSWLPSPSNDSTNIDHVLDCFLAQRSAPSFVTWAHKTDRRVGPLRKGNQHLRAGAHLSDRARSRVEPSRSTRSGWNPESGNPVGEPSRSGRQYVVHAGLGRELDIGIGQPPASWPAFVLVRQILRPKT